MEAQAKLRTALRRFADMQAEPWVAKARDELARTGIDGPPAEPPRVHRPEPAATRIAGLAASGLTNKEIGQHLRLSPRRVSTHLYQIFPKLNVTTRAALRDALNAQRGARGTREQP